jgi:hypothetical protein
MPSQQLLLHKGITKQTFTNLSHRVSFLHAQYTKTRGLMDNLSIRTHRHTL